MTAEPERPGDGQARALLDEFLDSLALEGRSRHSVRAYRIDLESLLGSLDRPLEEVRAPELREHFRRLQEAGRSAPAINRAIAATRSFFRYLVENRYLEASPATAVRSIRVGPSLAPKHLTVDEADRLLDQPRTESSTGQRDLAILSLLYNTGLRVGELCRLDRDHVKLPSRGWGEVQVVGKGQRVRWVPVNSHAREALYHYLAGRLDGQPALFINRNGERFSERGVALLVNRYLQRIGVADRSGPHLLRHTFATHSLRARPNLRALQELLGHASVTTTQRYTHMEAVDLQAQVAEMPANRFRH